MLLFLCSGFCLCFCQFSFRAFVRAKCFPSFLSQSQCSNFDSLRAQDLHFRANGATALLLDYPTSSSSSEKNAHRSEVLHVKFLFYAIMN